jgi:cytochrome c biogenesis protein CcmG, thiol:disulfide interchange protein DsbE
MIRYLLPLGLFIGLVVIFIYGLQHDPRHVPSPLIGKPAPEFMLPTLHTAEKTIQVSDLKGKVTLLNIWASWCAACRVEHPVLIEASKNPSINLYGLNYKDKRDEAIQWLDKLGNPYIEHAYDETGSISIDYGVYGAPETFVIDKKGIIRYKHIGPVSNQQMETIILPLVKELESESA